MTSCTSSGKSGARSASTLSSLRSTVTSIDAGVDPGNVELQREDVAVSESVDGHPRAFSFEEPVRHPVEPRGRDPYAEAS